MEIPRLPVLPEIPDVQLTGTEYNSKSGFSRDFQRAFLKNGDVIVLCRGDPEQETWNICWSEIVSNLQLIQRRAILLSTASDRRYLRFFPPCLELAIPGREGKPVGAIIVLGDQKKVLLCRVQLVSILSRGPRMNLLISNSPMLKSFLRLMGLINSENDGLFLFRRRIL